MIGVLLRLIGLCPHEHYRHERKRNTKGESVGPRLLVCDDCGRTVQTITRTAGDRKLAKGLKARAIKAPKREPVTEPLSDNVRPMPKRRVG